jgi:peptidoglycan/LPS O-acetylase OafA/YrhL
VTEEVRRLGRVPAFDSLRAIAVLLVLLHHTWAVFPIGEPDAWWTRSGFLGVDLFFVLSGFLITALLLQERHDDGGIRAGRFYARRALRLLPALVFFFAAYLVYAAIAGWPPLDYGPFQPSLDARRGFAIDSVVATFLYVMNWRVLWHPLQSHDLTPIWSLSIEEQFYWVWPLVLGVVAAAAARARAAWLLLAAAAIAVAIWRAVVFERWGWPAAYLRTDTRIDGLLWGAFAAVLFFHARLPRSLPRWTPVAVALVWAGLLATVRADGRSAYFGGITLWVLSAAVLIVHLANRPERYANGPLALVTQRIGRVSYALYLWQLPVLRAVERETTGWAVGWRIVLAMLVIATGTVVSWFLVERPALDVKRRLQGRWARGLSPSGFAG